MDSYSKAEPSVQRNTKMLVRLINASKYTRDDVLDLVSAYISMHEKAVEYQCLYTTERLSREKLEAENTFLTKLIDK